MGLRNLFGGPLAGSPIEDKTFSHKPVEGSAGLFHGGLDVGAVAETHVDVVLLEAFQAGFEALDNMLS
jgi:hypothetical protein